MMLNSNLYNEVEIDTDVMSANPHRLIQLLLQKCQAHIHAAKKQMLNGQIGSKWQTIQKALDIISYLRICLNFNDAQCKPMAEELDRLYTYIQKQIITANTQNKTQPLEEVLVLLGTIQSGWDGANKDKHHV